MKLKLFEAYGIELEYMIVHRDTLNVLPVTDKLMHAVHGEYLSEYEKDGISWSNELALHVVELKTSLPSPSLVGLEKQFQNDIQHINQLLAPLHGQLMPSAMHPWMNPHQEMMLWPHAQNEIYSTFHRIFNCTGHGWANLQSCHINLPFSNEQEFVRLHAAIRMVLPLIPALAASSPIMDGRRSGWRDTRLEVYRTNSQKIPSIIGHVIPEVCRSFDDYERQIFKRIYADISPHDPEKILQHEWLNHRGAITRFDRYAIEIRLVDVQEAPVVDLAVAYALVRIVQELAQERWVSLHALHSHHEESLKQILVECIKHGEDALIDNRSYLEVFGYKGRSPCKAKDLLEYLLAEILHRSEAPKYYSVLEKILKHGTLSSRILKAVGDHDQKDRLQEVYRELTNHLRVGQQFIP